MKIERIQTPAIYSPRFVYRRDGATGTVGERAVELDPDQNRSGGQGYFGQSSQKDSDGKAEENPENAGKETKPVQPHLDIVV